MPVFNPMAYAAKQEKKSWTPARQAKEDAANTLQGAIRNKNARNTMESLTPAWKEYAAEAQKIMVKLLTSADIYNEELKALPKESELRQPLKEMRDWDLKRANELKNAIKRIQWLDLTQYDDELWEGMSTPSTLPSTPGWGNMGRDFFAKTPKKLIRTPR